MNIDALHDGVALKSQAPARTISPFSKRHALANVEQGMSLFACQ